ncbi:hypothetical protein HanIR_Chr04g0206801 [Helianthus annuus]|nr:hypothetical protein HanIR_Chr04g0206801 [Helianthus annuus]
MHGLRSGVRTNLHSRVRVIIGRKDITEGGKFVILFGKFGLVLGY